jgi:hypothetical protein
MATVQTKGEPLRENEYTAGGAIKIGDFVTLNSAGQVVVATASQALCGIANSVAVNAGDLVKVFDHPDQLILVNPSATTPSALTDFNLNYNIIANTSTSASEGAMTLDSASGAVTATLPLKALRLPAVVGQTIAVGGYQVVCMINNHQLAAGTGSAGT